MLKLIPTKDLDQTTTLSHQNFSLAPSSVRFGSNFHPKGIFTLFSYPMVHGVTKIGYQAVLR